MYKSLVVLRKNLAQNADCSLDLIGSDKSLYRLCHVWLRNGSKDIIYNSDIALVKPFEEFFNLTMAKSCFSFENKTYKNRDNSETKNNKNMIKSCIKQSSRTCLLN